MVDDAKDATAPEGDEAPKINDKRKVDRETGEPVPEGRVGDGFRKKETAAKAGKGDSAPRSDAKDAPGDAKDAPEGASDAPADEAPLDDLDLAPAEGADIEFTDEDLALLAETERDLVGEYRERAARAEAELKNFRTRVERDRQANREVVIAEVIRSLLPAIDDLDRAEAHGDLTEGNPLTIVAQKLRSTFEKYGLTKVGEKGERFDPKLHEALVRLPSADVEFDTVADVIESGYLLGERLIRAARVAVSTPE